jgi:5-oxoprolinase (ATP-hydrolysing)
VRREIEFRRPLTVSILSERRALRPYGMAGGGAGACGVNTLFRRAGDGRRAVNLGGKATVDVAAGDVLRIETPGGGGWGRAGAGEDRPVELAADDDEEGEVALARARAANGWRGAMGAAAAALPPAAELTPDESPLGFTGSIGKRAEVQMTAS